MTALRTRKVSHTQSTAGFSHPAPCHRGRGDLGPLVSALGLPGDLPGLAPSSPSISRARAGHCQPGPFTQKQRHFLKASYPMDRQGFSKRSAASSCLEGKGSLLKGHFFPTDSQPALFPWWKTEGFFLSCTLLGCSSLTLGPHKAAWGWRTSSGCCLECSRMEPQFQLCGQEAHE